MRIDDPDRSVLVVGLAVQAGLLDRQRLADVSALVEQAISEHHGDAAAAVAALVPGGVLRELGREAADAGSPTLTGMTPPPEGHVLLHTIDRADEASERYTLSRLHAKGGIGQVWLARDESLGRDVAFKEIRPERSGNASVWSRFLREARITGQLEHPGIVPVYELSRRPESSAPFYTMRFVRGRTLRDAIAAYHEKVSAGSAGPLDLQALLTAFVGVANAVAYAHSKGVIHRDLKGDNVVLGDYGEVVVLDWGLAKVLGQADEGVSGEIDGDAAPLETAHGQVLGTPAYMAPEQAAGQLDRIGTRTDVYGLGAILYEILTGRPPFTGGDTLEVLRRVATEPPPRPRAVRSETPPQLDAICAKALAKEPADRYASAVEVAEEVRRFLADEPVRAYPEPLSRRASRWVRRHKPLVAGAAALLVTAVVALSAGTVMLRQKQDEIEAQRARAEENFRLARNAVDRYLTRIADSPELKAKGLETLRRQLFGTAKSFYERFASQRGDDPSVRVDLGSASMMLADIDRQTGEPEAAEKAALRAVEVFEDLARHYPEDPSFKKSACGALGNLALLYSDMGKRDLAKATFERAIALEDAFRGDDAGDPSFLTSLANAYDNFGNLLLAMGRPADAEVVYEKGLGIRERVSRAHPADDDYASALVKSHANLATLYATTGKAAEAEPHLAAGMALGERLISAHPGEPGHQNDLAAVLNNLGGVCTLTGRPAEAKAAYERSLAIREKVTAEHPTILEYRLHLGGSYTNLGELECRAKRPEAALPRLDQAIATFQGVLEKQPQHATARYYLAYTLSWRARALDALGRGREALAEWDRAAGFNDRQDPTILSGWAVSLARHGEVAKAVARAGELSKLERVPEEVLYDVAAAYSLASAAPAEDAAARARYADLAAGTLSRLAATGWLDTPGARDTARTDPDLAAVRSRPDVRKLL